MKQKLNKIAVSKITITDDFVKCEKCGDILGLDEHLKFKSHINIILGFHLLHYGCTHD